MPVYSTHNQDGSSVRAPSVRPLAHPLPSPDRPPTPRRPLARAASVEPDSASFEAERRGREGERLSDLSERKASPSRRATDGGEDLDGGRREWKWEGDIRKCSHISWKKEKKPSAAAVFYGPGFRFKMPSQCPQLTHTERAEMVTQTAPLTHPPAPSPPLHTMANTDICESRKWLVRTPRSSRTRSTFWISIDMNFNIKSRTYGIESRNQPDGFMHKLAGQMGQEQRGWMPCKHEGSAHVHLYALEREDELAVAVGHLSPSLPLLRSLSSPRSPPSFEAPGIFPGSLLQPVYNRQQRARGRARSVAAAARNKTLF